MRTLLASLLLTASIPAPTPPPAQPCALLWERWRSNLPSGEGDSDRTRYHVLSIGTDHTIVVATFMGTPIRAWLASPANQAPPFSLKSRVVATAMGICSIDGFMLQIFDVTPPYITTMLVP